MQTSNPPKKQCSHCKQERTLKYFRAKGTKCRFCQGERVKQNQAAKKQELFY